MPNFFRAAVLAASLAVCAAPAEAQTSRADRAAAIRTLLDALAAAPSEEAAAPLEGRITRMWFEQATPAVGLLLARGMRDLDVGAVGDAVQDFDDAIALDPDVPELWHRRAIARWHAGDASGAIRDIEETLRREPRHFGALKTLGAIAEERKDWRGACAAQQKLMEIDPKTPGGAARLKDLKRRALGDQT